MPVTNRGSARQLNGFFRAQNVPTTFYMALFTSTTVPVRTTNLISDLTQLAAGNGYVNGGIAVARNTTDFDVLTEDDGNNRALIQIKDIVFTASGGNLGPCRYCGLTTDEVTVNNREVVATGDLVSDRTVSDGQSLTIANFEIRAEQQP